MTTTLAQLGLLLGLDTSTVSLALRDSPRVAAATRLRVREAAQRHDYRPNLAARQLVGRGRPQLVGLVMPDALSSLSSQVVARTARRLAELAQSEGLALTIAPTSAIAADDGTGLRPDGLFVWGDVPAEQAAALARRRPVVVLDPNHPSYRGYAGHVVALDNLGVGALLARHLAGRGARRLLIVRYRGDHLQHQDRWDGARAAWIADHAMTSVAMAYADELDEACLRGFAGQRDGAILCSGDHTALIVLRRLQQLGLRVPDDVRLAGVDGDDTGRLFGLTSARFASEALAEAAFASLRVQLAGGEPARVDPLPFTLLPGDTA